MAILLNPPIIQAGGVTGNQVSTGASSANIALPAAANGNNPRAVLLTCTQYAHVKLGMDNTVVAAANDLMISPNFPQAIYTHGYAYIAYIEEGAAGKLNISPIEM